MVAYKKFLTAVLITVALTGLTYTQNNTLKDLTTNKYALPNLIAGIHSDNDGVRRSSIYLAGYYRVTEVVDELIAQLKNEKNESTRILIALVLYELGSEKGLLEVKDLSVNDENAKVRRMATHIYDEYLVKSSESTVYNTK